ncbi:MAG TPA: ATP-binding cassette domain-containing protein, partial [Gemmatimonadaceae bacterium]|nr:ATP-binding cassette domain-containing protein [Gemmatimonadaceae bacterium]
MTLALEIDGLRKRFGAVEALAGATLRVREGTVHALLGENGAGKTTLMRAVYGMLRVDAGTLRIFGQEVRPRSSAEAIARGVGMVHQHFTLVPAMTVAENVALGMHGRYDAAQAAERVRTLGRRTGLALDPAARVADLPVGAQQRLEILKALARDARLLILDEPTAVLAPDEAEDLMRWIRRFRDEGHAVVLIT